MRGGRDATAGLGDGVFCPADSGQQNGPADPAIHVVGVELEQPVRRGDGILGTVHFLAKEPGLIDHGVGEERIKLLGSAEIGKLAASGSLPARNSPRVTKLAGSRGALTSSPPPGRRLPGLVLQGIAYPGTIKEDASRAMIVSRQHVQICQRFLIFAQDAENNCSGQPCLSEIRVELQGPIQIGTGLVEVLTLSERHFAASGEGPWREGPQRRTGRVVGSGFLVLPEQVVAAGLQKPAAEIVRMLADEPLDEGQCVAMPAAGSEVACPQEVAAGAAADDESNPGGRKAGQIRLLGGGCGLRVGRQGAIGQFVEPPCQIRVAAEHCGRAPR